MHFEDLTQYEYHLDQRLSKIQNVGWLADSKYKRGKVPPNFTARLKTLLEEAKFRVNPIRGTHPCNICGEHSFDSALIGSCELWVPSTRDVIYAAPSMIVHYIEIHGYKPPEQFISAVLQIDIHREYDGQLEYDHAIRSKP